MKLRLVVLLAVLISIFQLVSFHTVGVEYDEALYVNSALGCQTKEMFVTLVRYKVGICFPVMVSAYLGGLPSYFYRLIFYFFGVSIFSLRIVNVMLFLILIILVYRFTLFLTNRQTAFWSVVILMLDFPFFLDAMYKSVVLFPTDLRVFSVLALIWGWKKNNKFGYILGGVAIGLAIWTKLDSIFFYTALFIPIFITYRSSLIKNYRMIKYVLLGALFGALPLIYFLLIFKTQAFQALHSVGSPFETAWFHKFSSILFPLISYPQMLAMFNFKIPLAGMLMGVFILGLFIFSVIYAFRVGTKLFKALVMSLALFILMFLCYLPLERSHHLELIFPIPQILVASVLVRMKLKQQIFVLTFLSLVYLSQIFLFSNLSKLNCGYRNWSCGLELVAQIASTSDKQVTIIDWGIADQLRVYSPNLVLNEIAYHDLERQKDEIKLAIKNCDLIVSHEATDIHFIGTVGEINNQVESASKYEKEIINSLGSGDRIVLYRCQ